MEVNDVDAVLAIEQSSFPIPWKREHFLHEISSNHTYPYVACADGLLAGYVCLMSLFEESQILNVAVAPDQRGKGIALALMTFAIETAREKAAEVMLLEVRASNAEAIALYERLDFKRTGVRNNYYEGVDDALLMEKQLKESL